MVIQSLTVLLLCTYVRLLILLYWFIFLFGFKLHLFFLSFIIIYSNFQVNECIEEYEELNVWFVNQARTKLMFVWRYEYEPLWTSDSGEVLQL